MTERFTQVATMLPTSNLLDFVVPALVVVTLAVVLPKILWKHDAREPVLIPGSRILGHLPGIYRHGTSYPEVLSAQIGQPPIYTVHILGQKFYTVNSGEVAALMSRKVKQLDAETGFIVVVFQNMLGVDKTSMKTLVAKPNPGEKGRRTPYREEMRTTEHKLLAPGESNHEFYARIMNSFVDVLQSMTREVEDHTQIKLMAWLEELYTRASGAGLYGKHSPFETQRRLVGDYWLWDSKMSAFLLQFFPRYTVGDAFQARERLVQTLQNCVKNSSDEEINAISRRRLEVSEKHSLSGDYLGRSELELLNGLLSNTVPAVFWMLAHIMAGSFSKQIVEEVGEFVQLQNGQGHSFDISRIRQRCPTLVATYSEALRLYASSARAYKVVEDFELPDGCLVKQGSLVYVPTETIHKNPQNWGRDVLEFQPERWLKSEHYHHPGSYAPFGVGSSICPGRHFVFDMILATLVILLYSFELESPIGGSVEVPERRSNIMSGMRLPARDLDVVLSRRHREGEHDTKWSFESVHSQAVKEPH